jgi:hypothetical protein
MGHSRPVMGLLYLYLDVILRTETVNIRNITSLGNGEYCIIRSLMFYVYHLILLILSNNAVNTGVKI